MRTISKIAGRGGLKRFWLRAVLGLLLVGTAATVGCQTTIGGVPYPSPHYLEHYPVYTPPDPSFTLQRERDSMLDPTGEIRRGGGNNPGIGPAPEKLGDPQPNK